MGHISFPVPVYSPIFFDQMLRLLRCTCHYCFYFRIAPEEVNRYSCKLQLLRHGLVTEAYELDLVRKGKKTSVDDHMEVDGEREEEDSDGEALMARREAFVRAAIKKANENMGGRRKQQDGIATVEHERRVLIREFMAAIGSSQRCQRCKGISPTFRKDGYSKIFEKPLSQKHQDLMALVGLTRRNPAMDRRAPVSKDQERRRYDEDAMDIDREIDDDVGKTQEEEEVAIGGIRTGQIPANRAGRLLSSLEVRNILYRLFANETEIFELLYQPRLFGKKGAKTPSPDMFFLHALAVPPTNFRPPAMTAGQIRENTQNVALGKILTDCYRIRDLNKLMADPENTTIKKAEILRGLYASFGNLQDDVNTFLDTTKSVSRLGASEMGIKQLLEKKEGLFRMHMMGKRVNYAARSVISPDPNIETSEIGVCFFFDGVVMEGLTILDIGTACVCEETHLP